MLQVATFLQCFLPTEVECRFLFGCQVGGMEFSSKGCPHKLAHIQLGFEALNPELKDDGFQG
jgi:hypothetical protein